jgi:hypothetical protein
VAYAAGWKKFEPLWDWIIRTRRTAAALPVLEAVLHGFGRDDCEPRRPPAAPEAAGALQGAS